VFRPEEKVGFISQTTQSLKVFEEIAEIIRQKYENHKVIKTICGTTGMRQKAAQELASEVDLMIIVGGRDSSNTTRLKEVCEKVVATRHIENENELMEDWFKEVKKVGISAGASTPYFSIESVIGWLHLRYDAKLI
jgi:4-hydroxy-3-methylbut-2-enyl diphosphate reductase